MNSGVTLEDISGQIFRTAYEVSLLNDVLNIAVDSGRAGEDDLFVLVNHTKATLIHVNERLDAALNDLSKAMQEREERISSPSKGGER